MLDDKSMNEYNQQLLEFRDYERAMRNVEDIESGKFIDDIKRAVKETVIDSHPFTQIYRQYFGGNEGRAKNLELQQRTGHSLFDNQGTVERNEAYQEQLNKYLKQPFTPIRQNGGYSRDQDAISSVLTMQNEVAPLYKNGGYTRNQDAVDSKMTMEESRQKSASCPPGKSYSRITGQCETIEDLTSIYHDMGYTDGNKKAI